MMENKYPYDNWKSITESDFVTLFIKTWFAFVSTLREMYPAEIPYYQATGDSRYISPYKRDFSQNIAYRLNYTDIKYHLYEVYKHGMKIIADRYPRFIVDDFYSLNLSFKETASEEFSLEGGFSGKFVCTVKWKCQEMTLADKEKAYLWFISFVYRLRNALFHEIIDPLNDEWQVIFKNSYHVLKQVVDQNIWRLKQLKLLPSASQAAAEEDYNREPPPDIDWPTDEEAKFTWFYYEMLKLNKDGARVLLKGKIDFAEHHYETECTVRWNESLSETAIKNASITSVVDSQEKELAAAI